MTFMKGLGKLTDHPVLLIKPQKLMFFLFSDLVKSQLDLKRPRLKSREADNREASQMAIDRRFCLFACQDARKGDGLNTQGIDGKVKPSI